MHHFTYRNAQFYAEDVPLADLAAAYGTPTYVYSAATLRRHYDVLDEALAGAAHTICFAVKANSNLAVLQLLAQRGAGFDIVSAGELQRVILAGGDPGKVVFSGVGKRDDEIALALRHSILALHVESEGELLRIEHVAAQLGVRAPVSLRVNPQVDPKTHKYIATGLATSKFGVDMRSAPALYRRAAASPHLRVVGIGSHIGSQILELQPMIEAVAKVLDLVHRLRAEGIPLHHLDIGGGIGIPYRDEDTVTPADFGQAITALVAPHGLHLITEPGRVIAGNAGILLTRVIGTKQNGNRNFIIVDAAMNDLLRPALYGAWHGIVPVQQQDRPEHVVDVVGPVCESGDFLAQDRLMPAVETGELLAVLAAGAYGFAMSSNYNSRPRACELLVDGASVHEARRREDSSDLCKGEALRPV